jgi:integrase
VLNTEENEIRRDSRDLKVISMAIRKRGSGWQIDYYSPTGKRVRQSFKTKQDAEAEHAKRISLIAEGRYLDVKKECKTTLSELFDKYTENYKHQASFQAAKKYYIKKFKEHFGEDTKLDRIRYVDLETYRNQLRQEVTVAGNLRSDAAVNRQTACLHHVFRKAAEWEMLEQSPFNKGGSLFLKENNQRMRYLSENEIKRLLAECPIHLRWIVECALHTGMRKGEILTLKWSQIRGSQIYLQKTNETMGSGLDMGHFGSDGDVSSPIQNVPCQDLTPYFMCFLSSKLASKKPSSVLLSKTSDFMT